MTTNGSELGPAQAALRFSIELAALAAWWVIGHALGDALAGSALAWVLAGVLPIIAATVWGTFRAPGDHSAGGAPVLVSGRIRLLVELVVLGGAVVGLASTGHPVAAAVLAAALAAHTAATVSRLRWLLTTDAPTSAAR